MMRPATRFVSFDASPGDPSSPASTPIYQTATFKLDSPASNGEYDYSRSGNPTRAVLERQLARLEYARSAFAFSSGMAAISAVTSLVNAGEEIIIGDDIYGGTHRLFSQLPRRSNIAVRSVDTSDLREFEAAITDRTRMIFFESPTNPMQRITDIPPLAELAHAHGVLVTVDNTLLSPWLQNPMKLGADLVIHSATKHLSGHSDVTAGCVVANEPELIDRLAWIQNAEGAALGPFDCWLLLRGLKTLALRLEKQQTSAERIAFHLADHPAIRRVHYAGLPDHPGGDILRRIARGAGSVISFEAGSAEVSRRIAESTLLFGITVSFGGLNSTISLPCLMSHASIDADSELTRPIPRDLIRISIGIEDCDDLIDDLDCAIDAAASARETQTASPAATS